MTEIAKIDWFGRWGTSVFSENTAIFCIHFMREEIQNAFVCLRFDCYTYIVASF